MGPATVEAPMAQHGNICKQRPFPVALRVLSTDRHERHERRDRHERHERRDRHERRERRDRHERRDRREGRQRRDRRERRQRRAPQRRQTRITRGPSRWVVSPPRKLAHSPLWSPFPPAKTKMKA